MTTRRQTATAFAALVIVGLILFVALLGTS